MCGFAGFLASDGHAPGEARQLARRMAERLRHRGPDAGDAWADERVALGHRRLSILDLSPSGAQPMADASGRYVIVFNGEIYNHLDLREALATEKAAPPWRGHSDTETLLAAIAHWGLDVSLQRAAGMFALALWDRREATLSLARDRLGEKPLYWSIAKGAVLFGSELKALRSHPAFAEETCREALGQYLRFAYVPAPRSIYRGTFKLEPGTILSVRGSPPGSFRMRRCGRGKATKPSRYGATGRSPTRSRPARQTPSAPMRRPLIYWRRHCPGPCAGSFCPTCRSAPFCRAASTVRQSSR